MRFSTKLLGLLSTLLSVGCGAAIDTEELGEPVSTTEEALSTPALWSIAQAFDDRWFVAQTGCPANAKYVVGAGFMGMNSGISDAYFARASGQQWDTFVGVYTTGHVEGLGVQTICSNARPTKRSAESAGGDATARCLAGEVAIGGGANCEDTDAYLYRSRPNPDTPNSEPTGWRAACSRGKVTTYVMCRDKDTTYDLTECKTERVDGQGAVNPTCDPGYYAISGGGYCSNGALEQVSTSENFTSTQAYCRSNTSEVHGYAVCCKRAP